MKYIVYFPNEREVIVCDPLDFASDENLEPENLKNLEGTIVNGVCIYEETPFNNAVLLQVGLYAFVD